MSNTLQRFLLDELDVRGAIVHLDSAWQAVLSRRDYAAPIAELLGQATVATLLMSSNIKFDGQLMLQLQSPNELSLLVVQSDNAYHFRSAARYNGGEAGQLSDITKDGVIAITIEADKGKTPYQGVVGISSDALSENLETYFSQSEQLQTLLVLRADGSRAAGILLQVMPSAQITDDDWTRLRHMAETLNLAECQDADTQTLIARIFAEDGKTIYDAETPAFECTCSTERTLGMLSSLETAELQDIVNSAEPIVVACDFCGQQYTHDTATIAALLSNKIHPN